MTLADEISVTHTVIDGNPVRCTIFRIGNTYHCVVASESPGGMLARSSGPTANDALATATEVARRQFTYG